MKLVTWRVLCGLGCTVEAALVLRRVLGRLRQGSCCMFACNFAIRSNLTQVPTPSVQASSAHIYKAPDLVEGPNAECRCACDVGAQPTATDGIYELASDSLWYVSCIDTEIPISLQPMEQSSCRRTYWYHTGRRVKCDFRQEHQNKVCGWLHSSAY